MDLHRQSSPSPFSSTSPLPFRCLTPLSLTGSPHRSCLNYLRDPTMKRYMERICCPEEAQKGLPHAAFNPAHSTPSEAEFKFSSLTPSPVPHPSRIPSTVVPNALSVDVPGAFHIGCSEHMDIDISAASFSSSVQFHEQHSTTCKSLKCSGVPCSDSSMEQNDHLRTGDHESMMLAAVDMGTNSFHMVVARVDCDGDFQVLDSEKEYVQLGSGSALGLITPEAETRAIETMKRFKTLACAYNAPLRVVATSAVREAVNRGSFVANIFEKVGIEVEVLSGREEACLIYRGVLQALPVYDKQVLVIDVGGGSTEVVVGITGRPIHAESIKLGHLRLTDIFIGSGNELVPKNQLSDMRKHVRKVLHESGIPERARSAGFELAIGSSGTIETIEQIINQGFAGDCVTLLITEQSQLESYGFRQREFTRHELGVVVQKLLKARTNEQRAKAFGLSLKRAEVLVAGAVLLEEIFIAFDIHKMRVSPYALREGVIIDTLSKTWDGYKFSPNVRWNSVLSLAKRFYDNQRFESASHSAYLALDIFNGLRMSMTSTGTDHISEVVSLFDEADAELLKASVTLHAIGMSIGFRDYHKHSNYLIKNNDSLVGYSPVETKAQVRTRALCAIARIAVALNRCHKSAVKAVFVIQESDTCVLVIVPSIDPGSNKLHDVSLELWAAQHKVELFEKVFKCKVSIVITDHRDELFQSG
ncbi:hypothetical protein KP509_10G000300 [Ceratopteris richardii]|uniref:Exopolyphosphatase n=1 Tax=Ceratopteris richardii TaxID=49495 RepID=A0A8T2TVS6_CERRI|nr:hypothetical protein KP509_10G000300 [Ceratopteris richardii]